MNSPYSPRSSFTVPFALRPSGFGAMPVNFGPLGVPARTPPLTMKLPVYGSYAIVPVTETPGRTGTPPEMPMPFGAGAASQNWPPRAFISVTTSCCRNESLPATRPSSALSSWSVIVRTSTAGAGRDSCVDCVSAGSAEATPADRPMPTVVMAAPNSTLPVTPSG